MGIYFFSELFQPKESDDIFKALTANIEWKQEPILVQIPFGGIVTYCNLVGDKKAARAAGIAVGKNPVGFILPCHRVIHSDGGFDGYFGGLS